MKQLNAKARSILDYVTQAISGGVPPSVREICAALNIKSTSTVHRYLRILEDEGYIVRDGNLNRAIRLPGENTVKVPLLGTVAAGTPILAVENIEDYIPYRTRYSGANDLFALRVKGESMINAGIFDGDVIIARRVSTADDGEIVVALVNDEATVKRFYRENDHYRLQPENDRMEPIIVDSCSILGKVVACLRFYE